MDISRLEKLAALGGLSLEGTDRERLRLEISALEALAATLPAMEDEEEPGPSHPAAPLEREAADGDRELVSDNTPAMDGVFFLTPGVPHRGDRDD